MYVMASMCAHCYQISTFSMVQTATLTVRVIKSFEYRTEKSLVLHDLDLDQITVATLKDKVFHGE